MKFTKVFQDKNYLKELFNSLNKWINKRILFIMNISIS
jgi:hypothetical protein